MNSFDEIQAALDRARETAGPEFTEHETLILVSGVIDQLHRARKSIVEDRTHLPHNSRGAGNAYLGVLRKLRPASAEQFVAKYGSPDRWEFGIDPCIFADCTEPRGENGLHCDQHRAQVRAKGVNA